MPARAANAAYFGLALREALSLACVSIFLALLLWPLLYSGQTPWVFAGFAFFFFTFGHMCLTSGRYVILPGLILFVACLQWVIAPWLSYRFPPSFALFAMYVPMEEYFAYAVPAAIALGVGLHLPLRFRKMDSCSQRMDCSVTKPYALLMDFFVIFGILMNRTILYLPGAYGFFYYILAQLRFVGVFVLLLAKARGWYWRAGLVYVDLLLWTSSGGVFYEFILWSGYLFIVMAYVYRWRWRLLLYLVMAIFLISLFNGIKQEYRYQLGEKQLSGIQRVFLIADLLTSSMHGEKSYPQYLGNRTFGDHLVRYNQGWIVSRIMGTVPRIEPYARGETVLSAIAASLIPRAFLPDKIVAAPKEFFRKYTDLPIADSTSMALGAVGEMYVNFGRGGGVLAVFVYGLVLGFLFRRFAKWASGNLLWWAWVPFVLLFAVEAEWNLADVLNHVTKSLVVMLVLIYGLPVIRKGLLRNKPGRDFNAVSAVSKDI
ncbi:MAG: hypothetical protein HY593_04110 [Candidatus Omnitrophica bacterium]|nr:hypothetical protein [Candidatus Omnitrophota bacterium]